MYLNIACLSIYKVKYLYFFLIILFYYSPTKAKEFVVSETQNKIEILDIYSNKFLLNKNYIIKNGDFMKSKNKISYLTFNKVKICLAKNSSIKVKKIKNNYMVIEHLKGSLLVNKENNSKLKLQIQILDNLILDIKDKIYTNQFEKNKFLLRNFSGVSFKSFNTKDIRKLKTNTTYKYDEKLQEIRINNILEDPLINNCLINKKNFNSNNLKSFSCIPTGKKLICGYK